MKILVDRDACEGHGICARRAPEVFEVGDDEQVVVLISEPGEHLRAKVEAAVEGCPRAAIKLEG